MKIFIVAVCIFACALASDVVPQVLRSDYAQAPNGEFQYNYETENGISGQVSGKLKDLGKDVVGLVVAGSNAYKSPEGDIYSLSYTADENGYQPKADYLPTPPAPVPIPDYIARAIEWAASHPYSEKKA